MIESGPVTPVPSLILLLVLPSLSFALTTVELGFNPGPVRTFKFFSSLALMDRLPRMLAFRCLKLSGSPPPKSPTASLCLETRGPRLPFGSTSSSTSSPVVTLVVLPLQFLLFYYYSESSTDELSLTVTLLLPILVPPPVTMSLL